MNLMCLLVRWIALEVCANCDSSPWLKEKGLPVSRLCRHEDPCTILVPKDRQDAAGNDGRSRSSSIVARKRMHIVLLFTPPPPPPHPTHPNSTQPNRTRKHKNKKQEIENKKKTDLRG
jgi:hypothetical protein